MEFDLVKVQAFREGLLGSLRKHSFIVSVKIALAIREELDIDPLVMELASINRYIKYLEEANILVAAQLLIVFNGKIDDLDSAKQVLHYFSLFGV